LIYELGKSTDQHFQAKLLPSPPARNPQLKLQGNAFGIPNSTLPLPSEFQSKKLSYHSEFQDAVHGIGVWIFFGITY